MSAPEMHLQANHEAHETANKQDGVEDEEPIELERVLRKRGKKIKQSNK